MVWTQENISWLKKIIWVIEVLRETFVCGNNSHSQDSNNPDDLFQSRKSFYSPLPFLPCSALTFRPCSPSISHIIPVYPLSPKASFAQIFSTGHFWLARFPVAAALQRLLRWNNLVVHRTFRLCPAKCSGNPLHFWSSSEHLVNL